MTQNQSKTIQVSKAFQPLWKPARYKAAYGGRGSGKSRGFVDMAVARASSEPGLRIICIREVQQSITQSVKQLVEDRIKALSVPNFRLLNAHTETPGDGIIVYKGMQNHTADDVKSLEGFDIALVEEAQKLSQRSLDLLRPTIRKEGSELWFGWNPDKDTDPVDKFFRSGHPPPDSTIVNMNWEDNPWFPDVLKADMEWDRERDADKYAHVWGGDYISASEARVFKNWRVDEFDTPDNTRFLFGADWGFSVDPTTLIRCWVKGRTLYIDYEAYAVGCAIEDTPAMFEGVPDAAKWPIVADSARPETIHHMQCHGFPRMIRAKKGKDSVKDGIEFLKNYDIVVHPRCKHVIDELAFYSYKVDPKTEEVLPILRDDNNHCIDALRYAVEGQRRAGAGPRITSI
ncbi:MAG: PBSX family phage terminase large subunit [Acinetobacter sp.]|nr:PBSX family phage terminase large subunit [Acinetobacter sp.]